VAGSAAVFLHSDHQDREQWTDEGSSNNTFSEPRRDYNRETPVKWLRESGLPITVEFLIAFCWIGMVASMPLIVILVEGGSVTRTQIITFAVMWFVLAGGIILLHKQLLFQSAHFEHHRSLTLVECVYLMSQILTTVGYGDITPANELSQVVIAVYVMLSLLIIANVASEAAAAIENQAVRMAAQLRKLMQMNLFGSMSRTWTGTTLTSTDHSDEMAESRTEMAASSGEPYLAPTRQWSRKVDLPPLPWPRLLQSLFVYLVFCVMGCMFYVNYPGENKTLTDGIYMSVITLSTVGFGAVTPSTEGGKVFGSFWMFFGSAALFKLVSDFMALIVMMKQRELWNPEEEMKKSLENISELPSNLTRHGFMKFSLVQRGLMRQKDVDMLDKAFSLLNPAADGTISKEDARRFLDFAY
jgi:hypothetical protein